MTDRDLVLQRIRTALSDVPPEEQTADVEVPRGYHGAAPAGPELLVELFAERAADYRAGVVRVRPEDAATAVARLLAERGVRSLVVPPGFPEELLAGTAGVAERLTDHPTGPDASGTDAKGLTKAQLDAADAVITTAALAIAPTGTVVLDAGPGQGRRVLSLLPDLHVCLIRADQIAADVPSALRRLDPSRPLTFISGPSATSDIENTRVEGVHGPRTLELILVDPDA